jgi:hypothetical protein
MLLRISSDCTGELALDFASPLPEVRPALVVDRDHRLRSQELTELDGVLAVIV